ncbi:MAG: hypothetical protein IJE18_07135 [Bacteroidaceae bacterium]|nr:hypothetical protein [Bacteroidaceae bacterium]
MEKSIVLRGIERNMSVSNSVDGGMAELVGWRHVDGNLRPATGLSKVNVSLRAGDRLLYVHKYGVYEHYIIWDSNGDLVYRERGGSAVLIEQEVRSVRQVVSIGHSIVVIGTELPDVQNIKGMRQWVWQGEQYKEVKLRHIPTMLFERMPGGYAGTSTAISVQGDIKLPAQWPSGGYPVESLETRRELAECYKAGQGELREEAYAADAFIDTILIRYGVRMYDGSYSFVSAPVMLPASAKYMFKAQVETDDLYVVESAKANVGIADGYKVDYRLYLDDELKSLDASILPYIDIFVSEPIDATSSVRTIDNISRAENAGGGYDAGDIFLTFAVEEEAFDMNEHSVYYRVESIRVEDVQKRSEDYIDGELRIGDKMGYLRQLPILERTHAQSIYDGASSIVYNGRLHIGDVTEYLMHELTLSQYSYVEADEGDSGLENLSQHVVIVYYDVDNAERVVRRTIGESWVGSMTSRLISVPDSRARKIVIAQRGLCAELPLQEHSMDNMAYYYNEEGIPWKTITDAEYNSLLSTAYNGAVDRRNVIKVSELHNAMLYGNDKTYTVGNGAVVAMAVATKAISEGQFGQYPLYVFSEDGVYALLSGSGEVLYGNIAPVSRHVVDRAGMVCGIDDAVVFGTRQGIFVLVGGEARKISNSLDDHGVRLTGNRSLHKIVEAFAGVTLSTRSMREVIREGMLGYDYVNNELLVYVPGDAYCYAYSFAEQLWHSYEYGVQYTVENYPNLHIVCSMGSSSAVYELSDEDSGITQDSMLLVTQPMTLGDAMNVKKIERIHLLSHIKGDGENCVMKIGMAVSNDGESWKLVWDRTMNVVTLHNVTLPHVASAYRYFSLIVYIPEIEKNSYINSVYVEYETMRMER